jgi:hypothetical protein
MELKNMQRNVRNLRPFSLISIQYLAMLPTEAPILVIRDTEFQHMQNI